MNVLFNTLSNNYHGYNTISKPKTPNTLSPQSKPTGPSQDEIRTARTKKVLSELRLLAFGAVIIYFAMKRNIKLEGIKKQNKKLEELAKIPKPKPNVMDAASLRRIYEGG